MAKKKATAKAGPTAAKRDTRPVRLDLSLADHSRIEQASRRFGLSKSAYVRQALFRQLEADEGRSGR